MKSMKSESSAYDDECRYYDPCPKEVSPTIIQEIDVDVLIVGSGPVGATFARKILDDQKHNYNVLMVDIGSAQSIRPGVHLKNAAVYQKDVNPFANVIRGHLHTLSVPVDTSTVPTLDPFSYKPPAGYPGALHQNNEQNPAVNLPGAAATYAVGGMATHWTCAIPRAHPTIEQSDILEPAEWNELYDEAEALYGRTQAAFNQSIRTTVVREALQQEYPELQAPYNPQNLPLSVERRGNNKTFFRWGSANTVLGEWGRDDNFSIDDADFTPARGMEGRRFVIKEQHICRELVKGADGNVSYAIIENLLHKTQTIVRAKKYIVCGGTVLGAQLLHKSNFRSPALGKYLVEQPMAFCQVVYNQNILEKVRTDPRFHEAVRDHLEHFPNDIPIPYSDVDPNCYIPVSEGRPWHCQIHRDAFAYGDTAPNVDSRLVLDFRWFGLGEQLVTNEVTFSDTEVDIFGMPQPTFNVRDSVANAQQHHDMMLDMVRATRSIGGFLPGSNPQFMAPGLVLHIHGVTRVGKDPETSVADCNSQVWGTTNLWVGGNGNINKGMAANPTLTASALAIKACRDSILQ